MPTSEQYQQTIDTLRKKYPPLAPHKFDIVTGNGPGRSVFYPAHALRNPRPGSHVIETREKGRELQAPEQIESWLLGDMVRMLPMLKADGTPYDAVYRSLKLAFLDTIVAYADKTIETYLDPTNPLPELVTALTTEQITLLDKMKNYVTVGNPEVPLGR
jgi:hypothetical protein